MTGISVGDYRDPERGLELGDLMREVAAVDGVERVRLSSVEVIHVRDSLLDALAEEPRICPHLHVPLQSGDDGVLASMGRHYDSAGYLRRDRAPARARAARERHDRRDRRLSRPRTRLRSSARSTSCARPASRGCTRSASRRAPAPMPTRSATRCRRRRRSAAAASCGACRRRSAAATAREARRDRGGAGRQGRRRAGLGLQPRLHALLPAGGAARRGDRRARAATPELLRRRRPLRARSCAQRRCTLDPVTITERIQADLTAATKAQDRPRVAALRLLLDAPPEGGQASARRPRRAARDRRAQARAQAMRGGGRGVPQGRARRAAAAEEAEAAMIDGYLPEQISEDELQKLVADALAETGAESQQRHGQGDVRGDGEGRRPGRRPAGQRAGQGAARLPTDIARADHTRPDVATELAGSEDAVLKALEGHLDCERVPARQRPHARRRARAR